MVPTSGELANIDPIGKIFANFNISKFSLHLCTFQGRLSKAYKPHTFWIVMLDALYQSLVIFFVAEAAYWDSDIGIWEFGTIITSSCLVTMSLHCAIEIRSWVSLATATKVWINLTFVFSPFQTILHVASIVISLSSFYVFAFFYNSVCVSCMNLPSNYWVIHMVMCDVKYYLIIALTAVLALLPRFTFRVIENTMFPSDAMKIVIQQKLNQRRGENLLVASWSRSTSDNDIGTSASSIYRYKFCLSFSGGSFSFRRVEKY
jgi:phospholipid-translocating ATPase